VSSHPTHCSIFQTAPSFVLIIFILPSNYRKYERAKSTLENSKKNEEILKQRDHELVQKVEIMNRKIEHIRKEAQSALER
jgi:hypothetical protein